MYICKQCNKNVEFGNFKVFDLYIFHLDCLDVYKSDQERLLREMAEISEYTRIIIEELGFLEGLKGHVRPELVQLYESQASHLLNEG